MKPVRQFNANEGDYSIGLAGPDAIEEDIDTLARMFDPLTTHTGGSQGGIALENIQNNAVSDDIIGDRTINDSIADAYVNTGKIGKLISLIAKAIKGIKGTNTWFEAPADTIKNIHTRVNTNASNMTNHKTSSDHDSRYYTKNLLDGGQLDNRYYRKAEMDPWLSVVGGETIIREEVFQIVNSNNGDGTFTYTKDGVNPIVGVLLANGEQVFNLTQGTYVLASNRVEITINDTLRRSVASGGVIEVSENSVALASPEGNGAEITIKYYERIGLTGEHNIVISSTKPTPTQGNTVWFKLK